MGQIPVSLKNMRTRPILKINGISSTMIWLTVQQRWHVTRFPLDNVTRYSPASCARTKVLKCPDIFLHQRSSLKKSSNSESPQTFSARWRTRWIYWFCKGQTSGLIWLWQLGIRPKNLNGQNCFKVNPVPLIGIYFPTEGWVVQFSIFCADCMVPLGTEGPKAKHCPLCWGLCSGSARWTW